MDWTLSTDNTRFANATRATPGWYWVFRPRNVGPRAYDVGVGILFLVYVKADGTLLSPLADFADANADVCFDASSERSYGTWFAGPISHGDTISGTVAAALGEHGVQTELTGQQPAAPGWYWCKTNDEAPLLLVDDAQVGPVFLDATDDGIHVFLASGRDGKPIDVGEFGFSEPLVSAGGVIDSTGMLNRNRAEFYGALPLPPELPDSFPAV